MEGLICSAWPLENNRKKKILQCCIKAMAHPGLKSGLQAAGFPQALARQRGLKKKGS